MDEIVVRAATVTDAPGMARVHVQSWRETYRGIVADEILDEAGFEERRARWWATAIIEGAEGTTAVAVAEHEGRLVGIASAGQPRDDDATWPVELFVVYLLAEYHGSGAAQRLMEAVIGAQPAALWVAGPNPRAQAFYRKYGFAPDGAEQDYGIPEIRMVRREPAPAEQRLTDLVLSVLDRPWATTEAERDSLLTDLGLPPMQIAAPHTRQDPRLVSAHCEDAGLWVFGAMFRDEFMAFNFFTHESVAAAVRPQYEALRTRLVERLGTPAEDWGPPSKPACCWFAEGRQVEMYCHGRESPGLQIGLSHAGRMAVHEAEAIRRDGSR